MAVSTPAQRDQFLHLLQGELQAAQQVVAEHHERAVISVLRWIDAEVFVKGKTTDVGVLSLPPAPPPNDPPLLFRSPRYTLPCRALPPPRSVPVPDPCVTPRPPPSEPEQASCANKDHLGDVPRPACPSCRKRMRWSDFAGGRYALGWTCCNFINCGSTTIQRGPSRWYCSECGSDVCDKCNQQELGSRSNGVDMAHCAANGPYLGVCSPRKVSYVEWSSVGSPRWDKQNAGAIIKTRSIASSVGTSQGLSDTSSPHHRPKGKARLTKASLLATPTSSHAPGCGIFSDADMMKEQVRKSLAKKEVKVSDFYKNAGLFQKIARSNWFENLTLGIIGFNAIWIAIDTDNNNAAMILDADLPFQFVEHFFCVFFSSEWLIRFLSFRHKGSGLKDAWFCFDSALVAAMVFETWVMTSLVLLFSTTSGGGLGNASVLRIARLLRLSRMARMARLLRVIPELVILVKGMVASMRSVMTTLFLLFIIMYVFGIAFAQLTSDTQVGTELFPNVPCSMYTLLLFGVLSLDFAQDIAEGLTELSPLAAVLYFLFVLLATFTVMNMLIGVLCEVVSAVAAAEKEQMLLAFAKEKLERIMLTLDTDGNGLISQQEFAKLLGHKKACQALHALGVDVVGLVDFADVIFEQLPGEEQDEPVQLTFPEFMDIVLQLRGTSNATVKDIVELRKLLRSVEDKQNRMLSRAEFLGIDKA